MISWRIHKKNSEIVIQYNSSPLLSYQAACGPRSPVIDRRITNNIDYEIEVLMDVLEHKKVLNMWWNNKLIIKELLGL